MQVPSICAAYFLCLINLCLKANPKKARMAIGGAPKRNRYTFKEQAEFVQQIRAAKNAGHCSTELALRKVSEEKGISADTLRIYYKKTEFSSRMQPIKSAVQENKL
jgi:hypothetical protein